MARPPSPALKPIFTLLAGAALTVSAAGQSAAGALGNIHVSASAATSWINNLSRTSHEPTRKDAQTYEFGVAANDARQLAPNLLVLANAEITALAVPDFDRADHLRFAGRLTVQTKFGLGAQATVLQAGLGANYKAARLDADRGTGADLEVQLSKRVLPNLKIAARTQWLEHNARHATFDLSQHSYALDVQWDVDEHWTLSGSAGRLSGDIVANAAWSIWAQAISGGFGPAVFDYYTSRPWEMSEIYGSGWVSYNVEADVDLWSVGLAYAFSDRTAVELRHAGAYVTNKLGITYPTDSWTLGLTHRF